MKKVRNILLMCSILVTVCMLQSQNVHAKEVEQCKELNTNSKCEVTRKEIFNTIEFMKLNQKNCFVTNENAEKENCEHTCSEVVNKATVDRDGSIQKVCTKCGEILETTVIPAPKEVAVAKTSVTYNGTAQEPKVAVTDCTGNEISSTYYLLSYKNNKNVGQATITVTLKGNYSGTLLATFTVRPKSTKITSISAKKKGFALKWKKQTSQTTGYQIQYATNNAFTSAKTVLVNKNKTVNKTVSKLTGKKTYYVRVRTYKNVKVKGTYKKIYSAWSAAKKVVTLDSNVKTVAQHTIFSNKQVNKRLGVIRNYYYKKPKQLTVRKRKIWSNGVVCDMKYYVHGKDLMFAYGTAGKTEYRLYFYKNQLIQMLVDKSGQSRKTYKQLYKRLEKITGYDGSEDLALYMDMENYARKEMEYTVSKKNKLLSNSLVIITKVSKDTIVYHKLNCYGPDGFLWSIDKKAYKAKVSANVSIEDYSNSPSGAGINRSLNWLKEDVAEPYLGIAVKLSGSGNTVSKIELPYFA